MPTGQIEPLVQNPQISIDEIASNASGASSQALDDIDDECDREESDLTENLIESHYYEMMIEAANFLKMNKITHEI